jgi:hypothetical protein
VHLAVAELFEARQVGRVVRPQHVVLVDQERVGQLEEPSNTAR